MFLLLSLLLSYYAVVVAQPGCRGSPDCPDRGNCTFAVCNFSQCFYTPCLSFVRFICVPGANGCSLCNSPNNNIPCANASNPCLLGTCLASGRCSFLTCEDRGLQCNVNTGCFNSSFGGPGTPPQQDDDRVSNNTWWIAIIFLLVFILLICVLIAYIKWRK